MRRAIALTLRSAMAAALWSALPSHAAEVLVAVAANFAAPLQRIGQEFTAASGHRLVLSSGATGKFAAQIRAGAPFQVLLSADAATPAALIGEGLAVPGSAFTYAIGRLALWSADAGLVDADGQVLASGRFRHLAIANPRSAPYGAAAMLTLKARGLDQRLAAQIVTGESLAQTWQFVHSGQAELGFVALSQVLAAVPPAGSHWLVPAHLHAPIRQDAVLLKPGADQPAARALLAWLKGPQARAVMQRWGYEAPL